MIGGSRGGKSEVRNWLDDLVAVEGIFGKEMDGAGLGEGIVLSDSRDAFKGDRKIVLDIDLIRRKNEQIDTEKIRTVVLGRGWSLAC
jgi:hypothetical protein